MNRSLAELDQALARLEEIVGQDGGGADSIVPNYLSTDAAGHVTATFTGHVVAQGVDLPVYVIGGLPPVPINPATNANWLEWLRADGSRAAGLYGFYDKTVAHFPGSLVAAAYDTTGVGRTYLIGDPYGVSDFSQIQNAVWTDVAAGKFAGTWGNSPAPEEPLGWKIDDLGNVQLKGRLTGQSVAAAPQNITVAGTFPQPRNNTTRRFPVVAAGPSGGTCGVIIGGDGSLQLFAYPLAGAANISAWVDVSAVRYST